MLGGFGLQRGHYQLTVISLRGLRRQQLFLVDEGLDGKEVVFRPSLRCLFEPTHDNLLLLLSGCEQLGNIWLVLGETYEEGLAILLLVDYVARVV